MSLSESFTAVLTFSSFIYFIIILLDFPGLRRRNKSKKDLREKEESDKAKSETPSTKTVGTEGPPVIKDDQNPQQDPLKWFGILVPQSLKQAQSSFKQGVVCYYRTW